MNVLALVSHPETGASTRYRIAQFLPALARRNIRVTLAPMLDDAAFARLYRPGGIVRKSLDWLSAARVRSAQIDAALGYDATFVLREVWPMRAPALERRLFERTKRVVFDFDDAVWMPNVSEANRALSFLKAADKAGWVASRARSLTPGNAFLARWAESRAGSGARVFELPSVVDTDRWAPAPRSDDGIVRLGWIGTHSTLPFLEARAGALDRSFARHPNLRLVIIGASTTRLRADRVENVPWSIEGEVEALSRVDAGLAPLPDTEWARGKCGLKLLQYMALGLPVVASPFGVQPHMIEEGVQGFLAADDSGWESAIDRLVEDVALRREMGARGRARIEERYSVRAVTPVLEQALSYAAEAA